MQATQHWSGYDLPCLHLWVAVVEVVRHTLIDALMRPRAIVVVSVASDNAVQLALIEDKRVVEAFSLEAADGAFADGISLRRSIGRLDLLNAGGLDD